MTDQAYPIGKPKGRLLFIGLPGHTVEYPRYQTASGLKYSSSSLCGYITDPDAAAADVADELATGAAVIDKRAALQAKPSLAFRSPLCDVSLPDGEVDRCPEPSAMFAGAVAGNQFGTLLSMQRLHNAKGTKAPGPLDSVCLSAYVAWWRDHGARIGTWTGAAIRWEGGE